MKKNKRSKKRWNWKDKHKRPCFKQYWYAPSSSWWYLRHYWSSNRIKEAEGLRALLDDKDCDYSFPFHHHHSLSWTWC